MSKKTSKSIPSSIPYAYDSDSDSDTNSSKNIMKFQELKTNEIILSLDIPSL